MRFDELLRAFTAAVEAGDGAGLARLFTEDGIYDDVFYGAFAGREAIAGMIADRFRRDGEAFRWRMIDPVSDGETGYAQWAFSYRSKMPHSAGRRVTMQGVGCFKLAPDGRIRRYSDIANAAVTLRQLGVPGEVMDKVLARWAADQNRKPEFAAHLAD